MSRRALALHVAAEDGRLHLPRSGQRLHLENDDGVAFADEVFHAGGVPVGEANAAVAGGAADGLRIVRAVNADAGFVQAHPENADEIVRAGREIIEIFRAHAVVRACLRRNETMARWSHAENFPCADRRGQGFRSRRDREYADELIVVEDFQQMLLGIDVNLASGERRIFRNFSFREFLDLERENIRHLQSFAGCRCSQFLPGLSF